MGACAQVSADLGAHILGQLIVNERRQFAKNMEAPSGFMSVGFGFRMVVLLHSRTLSHGVYPFATKSAYAHARRLIRSLLAHSAHGEQTSARDEAGILRLVHSSP